MVVTFKAELNLLLHTPAVLVDTDWIRHSEGTRKWSGSGGEEMEYTVPIGDMKHGESPSTTDSVIPVNLK
jgi:hypothetical protein